MTLVTTVDVISATRCAIERLVNGSRLARFAGGELPFIVTGLRNPSLPLIRLDKEAW